MARIYRPNLYSNGYWLFNEVGEDGVYGLDYIIVAPDGQETNFYNDLDKGRIFVSNGKGKFVKTPSETPHEYFNSVVKTRLVGGTFQDQVSNATTGYDDGWRDGYEFGRKEGKKIGNKEGREEATKELREKLFDL